jgi:L-ascorbate metabolism protein UlaG (beta-lactamase superfamily)
MDGVRVLTDPVLRNRVVHLRRAVGVDASALGDVDAALISHLHFDHLDKPSLQRLGKGTQIVLPTGAARLLRRKGFSEVTEISAGEELTIGSLRVTATPAHHDERRLPLGVRAEPLGYIVRASSSVYFAGDTDLFDGMRSFGPLDLALVPIWGWGRSVGKGHLDPLRAAKALSLLGPKLAVPIHWGTYSAAWARPSGRAPAEAFVVAALEEAPEVDVRVLPVGGGLEVS